MPGAAPVQVHINDLIEKPEQMRDFKGMMFIGGFSYVHLTGGARAEHSCAVTDEAELHCWGQNTEGQAAAEDDVGAAPPMRVGGAAPEGRPSSGRVPSASMVSMGVMPAMASLVKAPNR